MTEVVTVHGRDHLLESMLLLQPCKESCSGNVALNNAFSDAAFSDKIHRIRMRFIARRFSVNGMCLVFF